VLLGFLYRSLDGGATFVKLTDPCVGKLSTLHVLATLTAASGGVLAGICAPRAGTGEEYVITSTDDGSTWQPLRPLPSGSFGELAAASASTIAVATAPTNGSGTWTARLLVTTDGGASWKTAETDTYQLSTAAVAWLGFETSMAGWWVADPNNIFFTTDGGAHFTKMPF